MWRHFGIPTVTVPMGTMADIGMPVGLTIAGRPYEDERMLRLGLAVEGLGSRRTVPPRTPELPATVWTAVVGAPGGALDARDASVTLEATREGDELVVRGTCAGEAIALWIDGEQVEPSLEGASFTARAPGSLAVVLVRGARGDAGAFARA